MRIIQGLWAAAAAAAVFAAPAAAVERDEPGVWTGQITPYVWAVGIGGDITPFAGAPTISFDKSFSEVLEDSDGAFFISGFARRDRFVVLGDFSYSASSKEGLVPPGVPATGKLRQTSLTLAAGYRAVAGPDWTLDILGGVRVWSLSSSIELFGGAIQKSPGDEFADAILAVRANVPLGPRWSVIAYGDIGVFQIGSHATSQFLLTVNYQLNDNIYLSAGYRELSVDYRDGGTRVDATMAGPLVGATWRF